jgi:hypothetical protein
MNVPRPRQRVHEVIVTKRIAFSVLVCCLWPRQLAVGLFDFFLRGGSGDAENVVVITLLLGCRCHLCYAQFDRF